MSNQEDIETFDAEWFGQRVGGKSADWVGRHLDEIPHHMVGRTPRFTRQNVADYLASTLVAPRYMETTGPRKANQ
ncbi:hypothetical protein GCM10025864_39110 [Luteimicrobium album]|uniref:Uncharacterized protein n=1 Tax=Luteimicrobium album TaxID=1054550 RepID=A0ABQ6I6T4_9MICO|nr:hypothetical protein [Luteimicrobium album]GMA26152.1 hypothetical protein GCM10025864_39110 [Luteimicrobium album]